MLLRANRLLSVAIWQRLEIIEVLILLQAGKNRIRLFNKNGSMSHIRGIELTLENENKTDRKSD